MSTFFGIEVTSDKVAVLQCEPGAQLLVSNACLLTPPKNPRARVCLNVFSPDDEDNAKSMVVFSANGLQTCMLKTFFTSNIGFRLAGPKIDGAVVHIVGAKMDPGFQFRTADDASDDDVEVEDEQVQEKEAKKGRKPEVTDDVAQGPAKRLKQGSDEVTEKKEGKSTKSEKVEAKSTAKKSEKEKKEMKKKVVKEVEIKSSEDDEAEEAVRKALAQPVKKSEDPPRRKDTKTLKSGLKIRDVLIGTGNPVRKGRNVAVKYTLSLPNGKVVDKSTKHAFKFRLGIGECIKGFDIGVAGMREGGERVVEVPSALAYGKRGAPPDIKPNTDLIFDVKVVKAW